MFDLIAEQRRRMADQLDQLDDDQWATPSACGEWTVREVAGHMTAGWNISLPKFALGMVRARGDFNKANLRFGRELGARPTNVIVDDLRTNAGDQFTPPGAGAEAPLSDCLVHSYDMFSVLDIEFEQDPAVVVQVMGNAFSKKTAKFFGTDVGQRHALRATDIDWVHENPGRLELQAPVFDLLLLSTGRKSAGDLA